MSTEPAPTGEVLAPFVAQDETEQFQAWPLAKRTMLEKHAAAMRELARAEQAPQSPPPPPAPEPAELERLREQARAEGREQGLAEGRDAARQELAQQIGILEQLLAQLHKPLNDLDSAVEEQLVELALEVGATLFGAQIERTPEQIRGIVHEAVLMLPVATNDVRVHVNPEDARLLLEHGAEQAPWEIVEDSSMQRGGCRVTTTASDVDATVTGRLKGLRDALSGLR